MGCKLGTETMKYTYIGKYRAHMHLHELGMIAFENKSLTHNWQNHYYLLLVLDLIEREVNCK